MTKILIHRLFFEYKNTAGHLKVHEHEVMAEKLIQDIEQNINW